MEVFSLICIIIAIVFINYSMYRGLGLPLACIIGTVFIYITSGLDTVGHRRGDLVQLAIITQIEGIFILGDQRMSE